MIPTRIGDDGDAARRELSEHLSRRYHKDYPVELVSKVCLAGNPDEISGRIDEYAAAGVEHLIFLYGGEPGDAESQFGRLRSEVVDR
ncbi:MAG: hypothetical protein GWN07_01885, partial [Actinobacteria bacterium]|nr:LLM class flavin-dependent oxidoreductase [Actinomycetota bacterium]NIX18656.1 hypothetical protein [Actinomycetota bacterium]